jgi:hypothetical protein
MFAYNPGVNDRSGEIIAQGSQNAAMINAQMMSDFGQNIAQFADSYVKGQERKAKAKSYADFLGMHGETLGIQPEWLEEYKKKPMNEQIALGDMLLNSYLPHQQRMEYLNTQASLYPRTGAGAGATPASQQIVHTF